ncbi:hypothetical protein ONV75_16050 [Clostridium sp. LQ25]|nr:hypothetical protein [Clostridium sp. LQ25]UZT08054.1 hypothetical protein ONV75_16050 [Clostridium sp. LQ25]
MLGTIVNTGTIITGTVAGCLIKKGIKLWIVLHQLYLHLHMV